MPKTASLSIETTANGVGSEVRVGVIELIGFIRKVIIEPDRLFLRLRDEVVNNEADRAPAAATRLLCSFHQNQKPNPVPAARAETESSVLMIR